MMAHSSAPPFISAERVRQLVSMKDIIEEMRRVLQLFSAGPTEGGVVQPVRTVIDVQDRGGFLAAMPAYSRKSDSLGAKLLTFYTGNGVRGIPSHQAIVLMFDADTGSLQALIDGVAVTNMRTAAASACAVEVLLPAPPQVLCIVGTGAQARSHAEALQVNLSFSEVRIWGRNPANARQCAEDIGGGVVIIESLEEAVRDADVIVTVTMATEPLVRGKWLKPGAVICSVGAAVPSWRELDDDVMTEAVVVADSREAALKEAGDVILSKAEVFAEIGEVLSGKKQLPVVPGPGRKFIIFKSLGMAVEDVASGKLIYDRYLQSQAATTS